MLPVIPGLTHTSAVSLASDTLTSSVIVTLASVHKNPNIGKLLNLYVATSSIIDENCYVVGFSQECVLSRN